MPGLRTESSMIITYANFDPWFAKWTYQIRLQFQVWKPETATVITTTIVNTTNTTVSNINIITAPTNVAKTIATVTTDTTTVILTAEREMCTVQTKISNSLKKKKREKRLTCSSSMVLLGLSQFKHTDHVWSLKLCGEFGFDTTFSRISYC